MKELLKYGQRGTFALSTWQNSFAKVENDIWSPENAAALADRLSLMATMRRPDKYLGNWQKKLLETRYLRCTPFTGKDGRRT